MESEWRARAMAFLVGNVFYCHDSDYASFRRHVLFLNEAREYLQDKYDGLRNREATSSRNRVQPEHPLKFSELPNEYTKYTHSGLKAYGVVLRDAFKDVERFASGRDRTEISNRFNQKAHDFDIDGRAQNPTSQASEQWFERVCERASDYLSFTREFYRYPHALRVVTDGRIVKAMVIRPPNGHSAYSKLNEIAHPSLKLRLGEEKRAYAAGLRAMKQNASSGRGRFLPGDILLVESLARDDGESYKIANEVIQFSRDLFA